MFERLVLLNSSEVIGRIPEFLLALCSDSAGQDGVHTNIVGTKFVGEGSRESYDGSLCGDLDGHAGRRNDTSDGTHVDDGPAAGRAHGWQHRLDHEEVRA